MSEREIDRLISEAREQRQKREFQKALKTIEKALEIAKELPEIQRKAKEGEIYHMEGTILYWMGKQYRDRGKIEEAFEINEKAIRLRKEDPIGSAYSIWQRFMYARELGKRDIDTDEIRISQERAYKVAFRLRDLQRIGDFLQNLVFLLQSEAEQQIDAERKRAKLIEAIEKYSNLLFIRQLAGDKRGEAMTLDRQAECCLSLAVLDLTEATKIYKEREDGEGLRRVEERKRDFLRFSLRKGQQ